MPLDKTEISATDQRYQHLALATTNQGKIAEMRQLLAHTAIRLSCQSDFTGKACAETAQTFIENALLKARFLAGYCNLPTVADDSGLCVVALDLQPGIYSARYAKAGEGANMDKLLRELAGERHRRAYFHCSIALVHSADDPAPQIYQAKWWGNIAKQAQGDGGFGYDPVFIPDEYPHATAAQLSAEQKNAISHRGRAMRDCLADLLR